MTPPVGFAKDRQRVSGTLVPHTGTADHGSTLSFGFWAAAGALEDPTRVSPLKPVMEDRRSAWDLA